MRTSSRSFSARLPALLGAAALAAVALAAPPPAGAQTFDQPAPADTLYELRHLSGTRSIGWIAAERGDTIVFRTLDGGEWRLDRRTAPLRRARGRVVEGEFWREDQNHSRLLFAPTGRSLHQGQAYFGLYVIVPFLGYGLTDDLTLAGGIPPFGGELANTPFWIAPKLSVMREPGREVAVGAVYAQFPEIDWNDDWDSPDPTPARTYRASIVYAVGTFGSEDQAFHLGTGVARYGTTDPVLRVPVMVGGEYRISRRWKWISENWILAPDGMLVSLGMRSIGERWTWDFALAAFPTEENVPYIPLFSFSYAFGPGR
jgi:hypothetical protein